MALRDRERQQLTERQATNSIPPPQTREIVCVQPAADGQRPQQIIVQTVVQNPGAAKSAVLAFVLAFFFGPLGMLYSTVVGGLLLLLLNVLLFCPTGGLIVLITWPIGCIWATVAASKPQ